MFDELWEYEDTIKELKECLIENPNSNGFNNLGVAHFEIGELENALKNFNLAIELNSENGIAYINRAELNAEWKNFDKAESDYGMAINSDSKNRSYWISRAHFYKEKGELQKALFDFKKAEQMDSNFKPVKEQIAEIEKELRIEPKSWIQKLIGIWRNKNPYFV